MLVPVTAMLVMLSTALPVLVRVTVCAALVVFTIWLAKVRPAADRLTAGAAVAPVPVRVNECGLPVALSVMVTAAARVPVAVGVNVTLIVQVPLAATEAPQVLVCA